MATGNINMVGGVNIAAITGPTKTLPVDADQVLILDSADSDKIKFAAASTLPSGNGDISGPASSTDTAVMLWSGTGGDTALDSKVLIDANGTVDIPTGEAYQINSGDVVDQDVTSGSSPTLDAANITGLTAAAVNTAGATMNADFDAQTVLAATADDTPAALTVTEQTLVGRLTGGNIAAVALGIADNNVVQIDHASPADNDFAKFTANGLEGRSYTETRNDLNVQASTVTPAGTTQTIDWANGNSIICDLGSASGDVTLTLSNPSTGMSYLIKFIQGATDRDVVLPAAVLIPGESAVTTLNITEVEDAIDALVLYYDGSNYLAQFSQTYG